MDVDSNIPSSPPLCAQDWVRPRKRLLEHDDTLSSDPIFSEDGSSEVGESGHLKRKRTYKGPWWAHGRQTTRKREQYAFADSGVWLPSEGSELSLDSLPASSQGQRETAIDQRFDSFCIDDTTEQKQTPTAAGLAAKIVLNCVDEEDENVDLSDMSLQGLPGHAITPLAQMVITKAMNQPDSDGFGAMTPEIRLFLSTNALTTLPPELWDLSNITVLSLRNNNLRTLPAGIGSLRRLKELNIAGNEIQWLPWELLDLIRSRQGAVLRLVTHPNPLWQPVDPAVIAAYDAISFKDTKKVLEQYLSNVPGCKSDDARIFETMIHRVARAWLASSQDGSVANMKPVYAASSRVRYYGIDGSSVVRGPHDTQSADHWLADLQPLAEPPSKTHAPSLFELAAHQIHTQLHLYSNSLFSGDVLAEVSAPVARALEIVRQVRSGDAPVCSVCRRRYLFKRAEWVEYWHCNMSASSSVPSQLLFLPFVRSVCSFGCAGRAWEEREIDRA